jgi:hypothetical protein
MFSFILQRNYFFAKFGTGWNGTEQLNFTKMAEKKTQVLRYFLLPTHFLAPSPLTPWPSPLSPFSADTTPSPSDTIPLCPSDSWCSLLFPLLLPPPLTLFDSCSYSSPDPTSSPLILPSAIQPPPPASSSSSDPFPPLPIHRKLPLTISSVRNPSIYICEVVNTQLPPSSPFHPALPLHPKVKLEVNHALFNLGGRGGKEG